ncbi:hypothetical protein AVEN_138465-1 [Araneus ventricosus]|uniref:Uncharacterized protein n=1 Tax=Araneus ventricosus TaxID=182803 RepID=A0A4Y2CG95_ARAVE|nr:hypothetical protein AVEN_138465-1 [Araneus ventricosus]
MLRNLKDAEKQITQFRARYSSPISDLYSYRMLIASYKTVLNMFEINCFGSGSHQSGITVIECRMSSTWNRLPGNYCRITPDCCLGWQPGIIIWDAISLDVGFCLAFFHGTIVSQLRYEL